MDIEAFYRENYHIVYGYLLSLCCDVHTAEDLTSETFLKAITKIGSYDGRVKASTWLCAIGRNLYFNELKKRKRQAPLNEAVAALHYNMEEALIQKQQVETINRLALELPEPKNQVFAMRQMGLSFRDIGDAFGKGESWARVNYFRAKEKILKGLEESQ